MQAKDDFVPYHCRGLRPALVGDTALANPISLQMTEPSVGVPAPVGRGDGDLLEAAGSKEGAPDGTALAVDPASPPNDQGVYAELPEGLAVIARRRRHERFLVKEKLRLQQEAERAAAEAAEELRRQEEERIRKEAAEKEEMLMRPSFSQVLRHSVLCSTPPCVGGLGDCRYIVVRVRWEPSMWKEQPMICINFDRRPRTQTKTNSAKIFRALILETHFIIITMSPRGRWSPS
jgi:hypothetical protein